jgi:hypothetical protein
MSALVGKSKPPAVRVVVDTFRFHQGLHAKNFRPLISLFEGVSDISPYQALVLGFLKPAKFVFFKFLNDSSFHTFSPKFRFSILFFSNFYLSIL